MWDLYKKINILKIILNCFEDADYTQKNNGEHSHYFKKQLQMRCMVFLLCKPPKYEYLDDSAVLPMTNAYIYIKHYACSDYLRSPYFVAYRSLGGEDQYHNTQQSVDFLLDKQQLPKYCYNYKATNIHSI